MSTRATIKIRQGNRTEDLYHHFDGYPEGVGVNLKSYIETTGIWELTRIYTDLVTGKTGDDTYEPSPYSHGDVDYVYIFDCDNHTLTCHHVNLILDPNKPIEDFPQVEIPDVEECWT